MSIDRSTALCNNNLMEALNHVWFDEGVREEEELVDKVSEWYDETSPEKHEEHLAEIRRAASRFIETREKWKAAHTANQSNEKPQLSQNELMQFRETQVVPMKAGEWMRKINDADSKKHSAREGLDAIFRYGKGWIWVGEENNRGEWVQIERDGERFDWQSSGRKYITLSTFPENMKSTKGGRTGKNTDKICAVMLEIDGDKTKDEYKSLKDAEKREYRRNNLMKTCRLLAIIGINPTTITFSGAKSYHCVFRLREPISQDDFEKNKKIISEAYKELGADASSGARNPVITRFPAGNYGVGDVLEPQQRLMYVDANAEVGFSEWCAALSKFVKVEEEQVKGNFAGPMVLVGEEEEKKWVMTPATWKRYLDDKGIYIINVNGENKLHMRENGILQMHKPLEIYNIIYNETRALDEKASDEFSRKSTALLKENLGEYAVNLKLSINKSKDDFKSVHIPYRNGLLVVHPDSYDFSKGDFKGYDYFGTEPSTKRDFVYTVEKSEYETFIERTCGILENDPRWQDRKLSIESYIGYLISDAKEPVNYMGIFTEQSMTSTNGRSGKGILITGAGQIRSLLKISMREMKEENKRRWIMSSYENEKIVFFDDAYEGVDLEEFFNRTDGNFTIEKKGRDIYTLNIDEAPKMVMATNYFPQVTGASKAGRFPLFEITNHYTNDHEPEDEFGHWLYSAWDDAEWHRFDSYIIRCVQVYLNNRIIRYKSDNMLEKAFMADNRIDDQTRDFLDLFFENHNLAGFYTYDDFEIEMKKFTGNNMLKIDGREFTKKVFVWCDLTGKARCERRKNNGKRGLKFSIIESVVRDDNHNEPSSLTVEPANVVEDYSDTDPLFGGLTSKNRDDEVVEHTIVPAIVPAIVPDLSNSNHSSLSSIRDDRDDLFTILEKNDDNNKEEKIKNNSSSEIEKTVHGVPIVPDSENERFFLDTYDKVKDRLHWFGDMAYLEIEEDGRLKWQVVYCRGPVPPPVDGKYTICGSTYEADGVGRVKGNEKIVFVEVE